jgi:hypothetical protein
MQRDDGQVFALHFDQIDSLRVVADQGGNVIQETLYDPFGGIIESANPALRICRRAYQTVIKFARLLSPIL